MRYPPKKNDRPQRGRNGENGMLKKIIFLGLLTYMHFAYAKDDAQLAIVPLLLGGLAAAGAIGGAMIGSSAQDRANETNLQSVREQMAFQERMSNSAYQRATTDMRAAGINPMMAYSQGGASSPAGSAADVQAASAAEGVNRAAASAVETYRFNKEMEQTDANIALTKAQEYAADRAASASEASAFETMQRAKKGTVEAEKSAISMPVFKKQLKYESDQVDYDKDFQKFDNINRRIQDGLNTTNSAKDLITPFKLGGKGSDKLPSHIFKNKRGELFDSKKGEYYNPKD